MGCYRQQDQQTKYTGSDVKGEEELRFGGLPLTIEGVECTIYFSMHAWETLKEMLKKAPAAPWRGQLRVTTMIEPKGDAERKKRNAALERLQGP